MLETSQQILAEASAEERGMAESFATCFMTTTLEQDLIPKDEARRIVDEHRRSATKDWQRTVYASLVALRVVKS